MHKWSESRTDLTADEAQASSGADLRRALTQAESEFARELFERHRLSLYRYLKGLLHSREEASEILQETYLRLLRQPSFEHVRANARAYLFQTATNLARDLFRYKALRSDEAQREAQSISGLNEPDWSGWPELALQGEQLATVIIEALQELDSNVREALLLHRFRDMTHQQIAARMGSSTRTVERHIKEGLSAIGRRLRAVS